MFCLQIIDWTDLMWGKQEAYRQYSVLLSVSTVPFMALYTHIQYHNLCNLFHIAVLLPHFLGLMCQAGSLEENKFNNLAMLPCLGSIVA